MNDYRAYVMYDYNSIYHFGTDGMKWGRRRYQNEDGSYKPGAEGRYYDEVGDSRKGSKAKTEPNKKSSNKSSSNSNEKKSSETVDRVKHFVRTHKKEIAIGAAAATALIAGAAIYKYKKGAASRAEKDISDEYKRITTKQSPIKAADVAKTVVKETTNKAPDFKVTPNTTKAAAEAVRKASDTVNYANTTKKVTNNYDNLKRAAADLNKRADQNLKDGEDFIQQMLKENEELLRKYRNGGV